MTEWMRSLFAWLTAPFGNQRGETLATLGASDADAVTPELWDEAFNYAADRQAIGNRLSGPDGSDAMIIEKTDLTRQPGDLIRFPLMGRLLATPRTGTQELEGQEEDLPVNSFSVSVSYFRHATAINKIALKVSQIKWPSDGAKLFAKWLGRTLDDDWMTRLLNTETTTNIVIYAGNKQSRANLQDGDVLTTTQLKRLQLKGRQRGVTPIRMSRYGELPWPVFALVLSDIDFYMLQGDDTYIQDVRLAAERGAKNPALTGATDMYKSMLIYVVDSVNPGDGFVGTYLRPEARLRTAINSSETSLSIGAATQVTNVNYGKYIPTSGTIRIGSEQMTVTGNSSNTITVSARSAGVAHAAGDLITQNNLGKVMLLGQRAMLRGWAMKPAMDMGSVINIKQERSYGFERGIGVDYMVGYGAVQSSGDTQPMNYAFMETSAPNPNNVG